MQCVTIVIFGRVKRAMTCQVNKKMSTKAKGIKSVLSVHHPTASLLGPELMAASTQASLIASWSMFVATLLNSELLATNGCI